MGSGDLTYPPQSAIVSMWAVRVKGEAQAQDELGAASSPRRGGVGRGRLRWVELGWAEVGGAKVG